MRIAPAGAIALLVAAGCAAPTRLTALWSDPAFRPSSLGKVMVVSLTGPTGLHRVHEAEFARSLSSRGIAAVALDRPTERDSISLLAAASDQGADAILISRLVDARLMQTNYPSITSYVAVPADYAAGWYAYYRSADQRAGAIGSLEGQPVRLEANLYRLAENQLVWSGLSETFLEDSSAADHEIRPYVGALTAALRPKTRGRR